MTSNSKKVMCKFDCTPRRLNKDTCDIYRKGFLKNYEPQFLTNVYNL